MHISSGPHSCEWTSPCSSMNCGLQNLVLIPVDPKYLYFQLQDPFVKFWLKIPFFFNTINGACGNTAKYWSPTGTCLICRVTPEDSSVDMEGTLTVLQVEAGHLHIPTQCRSCFREWWPLQVSVTAQHPGDDPGLLQRGQPVRQGPEATSMTSSIPQQLQPVSVGASLPGIWMP